MSERKHPPEKRFTLVVDEYELNALYVAGVVSYEQGIFDYQDLEVKRGFDNVLTLLTHEMEDADLLVVGEGEDSNHDT